MTSFTGRLYWTSDNAETLCYWDSATGQIHRLVGYDPELPELDGYPIANNGGFGVGMFLGDGSILVRVEASGSQPQAFALTLDADLDPTSAELWYYDSSVALMPLDYAEARYSSGLLADADIWLHWYPAGRSVSNDTPSWVRFDASGSAVEEAAVFPDSNNQPPGWGGSYVYRDGFMYRALNANEGTFDRYRLSDGLWERAYIPRPANTNGGTIFVGITSAGDFVFQMSYQSNDGSDVYPYQERSKKLWVVNEADMVFTSGVFNGYDGTAISGSVPDRIWPMNPPGLTYSDYYTEGEGGGNVVIVRGDSAYFAVHYASGYGFDDAYICHGDIGAVWELNLLDGTMEQLFGIPYGGYLEDGTYTNDGNVSWFGTTSGFAFGLFDGTGESPPDGPVALPYRDVFPRSDGRGAGARGQVFPRPSSRQASNQITGNF